MPILNDVIMYCKNSICYLKYPVPGGKIHFIACHEIQEESAVKIQTYSM